jgi:hypothetical protein
MENGIAFGPNIVAFDPNGIAFGHDASQFELLLPKFSFQLAAQLIQFVAEHQNQQEFGSIEPFYRILHHL